MVITVTVSKPSFEQYPQWAKETIGFDPEDANFLRRYELNSLNLKTTILKSDTWNNLISGLEALAVSYRTEFGVELLTRNERAPELNIKPIKSVVEKTFRFNVLSNKNFPDPPTIRKLGDTHKEWITEANLYLSMNDLIRGRVTCRYMDGPEYLCENLKNLLDAGASAKYHSMETDLGYYAWHLRARVMSLIHKPNGDVAEEPILFEIQATTHLQDILNDLTHAFYEEKRLARGAGDSLWKWRPSDAQFQGAYFGHTLHLLEGMIVELKNKIAKSAESQR